MRALMPLTIDKKYLISINNRSGQRSQGPFTLAKASGADVLPATKGNVTMHASRSGDGNTIAFPTSLLSSVRPQCRFPRIYIYPD